MINAKLVGGSAVKYKLDTGKDLIVPIEEVVEYYDLNCSCSLLTENVTQEPDAVEMRVERFKHKRSAQDSAMGVIEVYEFQEIIEIQSKSPPKI